MTEANHTLEWDSRRRLALQMDEWDELAGFRREFDIPRYTSVQNNVEEEPSDGPPWNGEGSDRQEVIYLAGNSLGLLPRRARQRIASHLDQWASMGVHGHFQGDEPWFAIEDRPAQLSVHLVGAEKATDVVYMNSLSVNLHLMMVAFYQPDPSSGRVKILMEEKAFPSDEHLVASQIRFHGLNPENSIVRVPASSEGHVLCTSAILETLLQEASTIALILLPGVHYLTGEVLAIEEVAKEANRLGIPIGLDLAHAVGNIELRLQEWGVDFACWCTYKYLNSGPGALSGAYLHGRHRHASELPRFAGWWGHERASRFMMEPTFVPQEGVRGFQLSNPSVFALAPVVASLTLFQEAGMPRLVRKSRSLGEYMARLLSHFLPNEVAVLTPEARGCQLS